MVWKMDDKQMSPQVNVSEMGFGTGDWGMRMHEYVLPLLLFILPLLTSLASL